MLVIFTHLSSGLDMQVSSLSYSQHNSPLVYEKLFITAEEKQIQITYKFYFNLYLNSNTIG